jgi:succinate dehydrogenase / fumarate reductase membrane anchor subunit
MLENNIISPAAGQRGQFERVARYFMRVSGLLLLAMALFHLLYMEFLVPGGVSHIDYAFIVAQWTDPAWGFLWRTFDLLLLLLGVSHGANGVRSILEERLRQPRHRAMATSLLLGICFLLLTGGAAIIFSV